MSAQGSSSVKVAVRVRPLNARERLEQNRICATVHNEDREIALGDDRVFTFDHVFDLACNQFSIYDSCVKSLVTGLFEGFNATVLAYGQTGSGKTYTMGTALDTVSNELTVDTGVIPRAIKQLFEEMLLRVETSKDKGLPEPKFNVLVQFVELYNEEIIDLLAQEKNPMGIRIHEDTTGSIALKGVTQTSVTGPLETLNTLRQGALNRTVGATNMNEVSSRSHAIFTLYLKQERASELTNESEAREVEFLSAKFHFVDLAGSERLKRTGAVGDRAKEGIAINCGLLSLGNVISVLGSNRGGHVPYRDSKLTRLLQDSLGGNSQTLMVACVSPSDGDFAETLNTLRYANRAKNITNKVSANQDKSSKIISELRQRILELETKLADYEAGKRQFDDDGVEVNTLQYQENMLLTSERNQLAMRVKTLEAANEALRSRLVNQQMSSYNIPTYSIPNGGEENGEEGEDAHTKAFQTVIEQLESVRSQLFESEARCDKLGAEVKRLKEQKEMSSIIAKMAFEGDVDGDQSNTMIETLDKAAIAECTRYILDLEGKSLARNDSIETEDYVDEGTVDDDDSSNNDDQLFEARNAMCEDLVDLQAAISHKERVIADLESSKNQLINMNKNILKQLQSSQERIEKIEAERDRVLNDLSKAEKGGSESAAAKKIKKQFEEKLNKLRAEQKALHAYETKCKTLERQKQKDLEQINKMKNEVKDLRTQKVKLQQNIVNENKKVQKALMEKRKFEAKAATQNRKYENKIRSLESHGNQLETFTKRTAEIMKQLKRELAKQSVRRAPATPKPNSVRNRVALPGKSKITGAEMWSNIEKNVASMINKGVLNLQLVEELERQVEARKVILNEISQVEDTFAKTRDQNVRDVLIDELASKREKFTYVQSQIHQLNSQICDLDTNQRVLVTFSNLFPLLSYVQQIMMEKFDVVYIQKPKHRSKCAYSKDAAKNGEERGRRAKERKEGIFMCD
uniref:Kinesin-like protein n=1 Tax=Steinernema glaseri TaxID=37863 RepID=A0A1I8A6U4_9BILA